MGNVLKPEYAKNRSFLLAMATTFSDDASLKISQK